MCIFQKVTPFVENNSELLDPQVEAYRAALSFYEEFPEPQYKETLIVMPTGCGKTGLMSLLPFQLSSGRVLIIAPGKIIRKTVFQELDSVSNPEETFWYKRNVILDRHLFPQSYVYKGWNSKDHSDRDRTIDKLKSADIVITNVHKITGSSPEQSLTNLIDEDFFDMIIIDEAHHVAADMWQKTIDHFNVSKIIKLTATPVRNDGQKVSNNPYDPIYSFGLGEAIRNGLIKDIIRKEEIPDKLEFYNPKNDQTYTPSQARALLGDEWVNETLIMSESCSKTVIKHTLNTLKEKRKSYPKHQALAVACNDEHARLLTKWFQDEGAKASYVSSHLSDFENETRISDFANNEYDVMINIQMLGEGFNNPNISIISMFRPFKSVSLYAQVIGRGLRLIREPDARESDNFCDVIYHKELQLEELWRRYKSEKAYADIKQTNITIQLSIDDFFNLGAVEKMPVPNHMPKDESTSKEESGTIRFAKRGNIKSYVSQGLGNEDSFSSDGLDRYRKTNVQTAINLEFKQQKDLMEKRKKYKKLLESSVIDVHEYNNLLSQTEKSNQQELQAEHDELKGFILLEQMKADFEIWLNSKVTDLFTQISLGEKGFELWEDAGIIAGDKINNIGYIVSNIRKTSFERTKKRITAYSAEDFAQAKESVKSKIEFYLKHYPAKKDKE
ncbi:DEAD/DEAH box helicase family protein [Domibacillus aminovorans]|uniref:DEAD/DEAH box helicase n=1 Tax=Domibacillus aminovorans TaxID=29332 RepID=UPI003D211C4D